MSHYKNFYVILADARECSCTSHAIISDRIPNYVVKKFEKFLNNSLIVLPLCICIAEHVGKWLKRRLAHAHHVTINSLSECTKQINTYIRRSNVIANRQAMKTEKKIAHPHVKTKQVKKSSKKKQ